MEEAYNLNCIFFLCCFLEQGQYKNHMQLSIPKILPGVGSEKKSKGQRKSGFLVWWSLTPFGWDLLHCWKQRSSASGPLQCMEASWQMQEQFPAPHLRPRETSIAPGLLCKYQNNEIKSWFRLAQEETGWVFLQKQNKCIFFFFSLLQHFKERRKSMKGKFWA